MTRHSLWAMGSGGWRCAAAAALLGFGAASAAADWTTSAASPTVVFDTPGTYQVELEVCNEESCTTVTRSVVVLDPAPLISGVSVSPGQVEEGQLVAFSGGASGGRPPLALKWRVRRALPPSLVEVSGGSAWWDTRGAALGVYLVSLVVTNGEGIEFESLPVPVEVVARRGSGFYTLPPCRLLDTRESAPLEGGVTRLVPIVGGDCGVPPGARAIAANVTVTNGSGRGHVSLFPANYPTPPTTSISFGPGQTRANNAVLLLGNDDSGALGAQALLPGGTVDLILDVSGYFLPE